MFEHIQHRNHTFTASAAQCVKGDVDLFHSMSEAMILEHAALTDTDFLIYTGDFCGYCRALKNLLKRRISVMLNTILTITTVSKSGRTGHWPSYGPRGV